MAALEVAGTKMNEAVSGVHAAIDKASAMARPAVDQITSGAHATLDQIADSAAQTAESLGIKAEQFHAARIRFSDSCGAQVREHPVAVLGLAVGAGFLLNWWLSRR